MKKNGFTLVELLAVILILGLIALIAIPQVLNLVQDSKKETVEISVQNYVRAVDQAILNKKIEEKSKKFDGEYEIINSGKQIKLDNNIIDIEYDGREIKTGTLIIRNYKVVNMKTKVDNLDAGYFGGKILVVTTTPKSFEEDDWSTIVFNTDSDKYKVGDTKEIKLEGYTNEEPGSNGLYTVRIANKSTDECIGKVTSQTACGFVIEFVDIITTHNMNPEGEYKGTEYYYGWNKDGYPASSMYKFLNDEEDDTIISIYESLPEEIRSVIKETKVISSHGSEDTSNFESTDKLYLLSTKEVWGKEGTSNVINNDTAEEETRQLDYYEQEGVTTQSGTYEASIKNYNGSPNWWWLRSARSDSMFYQNSVGSWHNNYAYSADGVAPAFRI